VPAVVPRAYAIHNAQKVGVLIMVAAPMSSPARDAARALDGSHPGGRYPAGGLCSRYVATIVMTKNTSAKIWKVLRQPTCSINDEAIGPNTPDPAP
jgi:hypothetical protein